MTDYRKKFDLSGKVGIVTGGAGILGRTFVEALTQQGSRVIVAEYSRESIAAFSAALPAALRDQVLFVECDVTSEDAVKRMLATGLQAFGRVDFLINNAVAPVLEPGPFFKPFEEYALDEWRRIMAVNIDGMFLTAKHVGGHIARHGGGSIVQISSIYGVMASDNRIYQGAEFKGYQINNPAIYSTSKAGVVGLTRWLATYWADKGVRVNAVAPGGVYSHENQEFVRRYSQRVPMNRMAHLDEIAGTIVYLVSDAASYVTGQCLMVDGGLSAW